MRLPPDDTERIILRDLGELWPELEVEIEPAELLVILTVRLPGTPPGRGPELQFVWLRCEDLVLGSVHPKSATGPWTVEGIPCGVPRLVVEAGVREFRSLAGQVPSA
jgi:hypothetical protein